MGRERETRDVTRRVPRVEGSETSHDGNGVRKGEETCVDTPDLRLPCSNSSVPYGRIGVYGSTCRDTEDMTVRDGTLPLHPSSLEEVDGTGSGRPSHVPSYGRSDSGRRVPVEGGPGWTWTFGTVVNRLRRGGERSGNTRR